MQFMTLLIAKRINIKLELEILHLIRHIQINTEENSRYLTTFLLLNVLQQPREYVYKTPNGILYKKINNISQYENGLENIFSTSHYLKHALRHLDNVFWIIRNKILCHQKCNKSAAWKTERNFKT